MPEPEDIAAGEPLHDQAANVALSVRMVSGMMTGVVESLGGVVGQLAKYETSIDDVHSSSLKLAGQMKQLVTLAAQVEGVLKLIEHISLQTRVLSLNATLEAARAGVAGRGFAVVAHSVKDLAKQTTEATAEIRTALEGIQGAAGTATTQSTVLDGAINTVRALTHTFVETLQEQAQVAQAATKYVDEAANSVDSIADTLKRADEPAQSVNAAAAEGEAVCH